MAAQRLTLLIAALTVWIGGYTVGWAASSPAAILSQLEINEEIDGDVVAVVGNVHLGSEAHVHGHAIAVLGSVEVDPGAQVDGRVIAISSLASLTLDQGTAEQPVMLALAVRLLTGGCWLLMATLVAFFLPARLNSGIRTTPVLGLRIVVLGALAMVTWIAALVAVLGLGPILGIPLAVTFALLFLAGKAVGLAVIGGVLGTWLTARFTRRFMPMTLYVFLGVCGLLLVRFIPYIGGALWTMVSVAALGAGVFTLVLQPAGDIVQVPVRPTRQ